MKWLRGLGILFLLVPAGAWAAAEGLFEIKPVVDGVYAAIAKPHVQSPRTILARKW